MTAGTEQIAFDGEDIRLVLSDQGGDICLLTYTPRPVNARLQQGFAKKFADSRGVSGAYLISRRAHWWQSPELAVVEDLVRDWPVFRQARHRLAYGGSMGGFGVLLSAGRIGCERALVSSPQTTFDPAYVTYPNRYARDTDGLAFSEPHAWTGVRDTCHYTVLYDPLDSFDRRQVALLEPFAMIDYLPVTFSSHSPLKLLQQAGVLEDIIFAMARGRFDLAEARRSLHDKKRHCSLYYATLAAKAMETRRMNLALWSAEQAFILEPESLLVFRTLAKLLRDSQDHAGLIRAAHTFIEAGGDVRAGKGQWLAGLYGAQDYEAALDLAREMATAPDGDAEDHRWIVLILQKLDRPDEAAAAAQAGLQAFPGNGRLATLLFDTLFAQRDYAAAMDIAVEIGTLTDIAAAERARIAELVANPRLSAIMKRRQEALRAEWFEAGNLIKALAVAEALAARPDADEEDIAWVSAILHQLGRSEEGLARAQAGLAEAPNEIRLLVAQFDNLYAMGRYTEAREIGERVVGHPEATASERWRTEKLMSPEGVRSTIDRQRAALFTALQFDEALALSQRVANEPDATADDKMWVGRLLHRLKRYDEAVTAMRAALLAHPGHLQLMRTLFDNLFARLDFAAAKGLLIDMLAHPDLAEADHSRLVGLLETPRLANVVPASWA